MTRDDDRMAPSRIQAIREGNGMTQAELADAVGSDIRTVQRWLAGDRSPRGAAVRLLEQLERKGNRKGKQATS